MVGFPFFVVEIFDCFVVEQVIDGLWIGCWVVFVDGVPDVDLLVADLHCEHDVGEQRDGGDDDEIDVVFDKQDVQN